MVVEAGTNDLHRTPRSRFAADYRSLLAAARAASPGARLLRLTMWIPEGAQGAPPTRIPAAFYGDAIRRECGDGTVVDISPLFDAAASRGPEGRSTFLGPGDDFHPNSARHAAVARLIASALSPSSGSARVIE